MTITITPEYLERIARLETPSNADSQTSYYCAQLRNAAKDLLMNSNNHDTRLELSQLVRKLEIKSV